MKHLLAFVCAVAIAVSPACALALTGQRYDTFETYYAENISFINENANRHLLPMVIARAISREKENHYDYTLSGDILNLDVLVDAAGVIESCLIRITAPSGMEYGNAIYNDFAISGYHSYALLMAMDTHTEPLDRYALVTAVVEGMRKNNGDYTQQLGVYTLTCERVNNTAFLSFQNNGAVEATPEPTDSPDATVSPDLSPESDDDYVG